MRTAKSKASFILVATMLIVALATVYAKGTLNSVSAFEFIWLQMVFAISSALFYTFGIGKEKLKIKLHLSSLMIVIGIGVFNFTLVRTLFIYSLEKLPVTTHAYLINFVGIVTLALSALVLKEPPKAWQLIGALIALIGIQIYFNVIPTGEELEGVILALGAVFFLAMTNILMRLLHLRHAGEISSQMVATIALIVGGSPLVIVGLTDVTSVAHIQLVDWLVIAANGIIGMTLVMIVFNWVMRELKAFEASILACTGLIFTALLSIPILGESLNLRQMSGIAFLFVGISIVQWKHR